jgi:hypothetical protein
VHKFNCEMDLARTYLKHGKLSLAWECCEAAYDVAAEMADSYRMQQADALGAEIASAGERAA